MLLSTMAQRRYNLAPQVTYPGPAPPSPRGLHSYLHESVTRESVVALARLLFFAFLFFSLLENRHDHVAGSNRLKPTEPCFSNGVSMTERSQFRTLSGTRLAFSATSLHESATHTDPCTTGGNPPYVQAPACQVFYAW